MCSSMCKREKAACKYFLAKSRPHGFCSDHHLPSFLSSCLAHCAVVDCQLNLWPMPESALHCSEGKWSDHDYACANAWSVATFVLDTHNDLLPPKGCNRLVLRAVEWVEMNYLITIRVRSTDERVYDVIVGAAEQPASMNPITRYSPFIRCARELGADPAYCTCK